VRIRKVPGTPVQNLISNRKVPGTPVQNLILLNLVKSLEIRKKSEKCKSNFARLLVKSTTTFVKLVLAVSL
jgi:hypothetical protein